MKSVNYGTCSFLVASERTDGIPDHAAEIEGDLIHLDVSNLNGWGINSSAIEELIKDGIGIPIRMCNNIDPHACDKKEDHGADIGYVTKIWQEGEWLKAKAAITDKTASQKIDDGTWTPFGKGKWSVAGYPTGEIDENNFLTQFMPASISFMTAPNEPAYEGSGFEVVVAALTNDSNHQTKTKEDENMTDPIESGDPVPALDGAAAGAGTLNEPVNAPVESEPIGTEVTMYDQEALDTKLAEALETQKAEYETQMAQMTPNTELETMFAAAKTEAIDATMDQISREKLTNEYIELVSASKVLSAPMMVDGKMDADKLTAKTEQVKQFTASVIQSMIDESKLMVAALPAGQNPFDAASIESNAPGAGFDYAAVRDEYNTKLGLK